MRNEIVATTGMTEGGKYYPVSRPSAHPIYDRV